MIYIRIVGTCVRGIRTPIIKEGDDLANIEMNTNINNSTLIRNNLYIYRIILSKSDNKNKMYENINLTQINIDLKSFNFMKKIVNKFEMIEDTTFEKLLLFTA